MLSRYLPSDGAIRSSALYGIPEMLAAVAMPLTGKNTERSAAVPDSVDFLRRLSLERSYFVLRVLPVSAVSVLVWNFSDCLHDPSVSFDMSFTFDESRLCASDYPLHEVCH